MWSESAEAHPDGSAQPAVLTAYAGPDLQRAAEAKAEMLRRAAGAAADLLGRGDRVAAPVVQDDPAGFFADYYRDVELQEMEAMAPRAVAGTALEHLALALRRAPGEALVRVHHPTDDEHGWSSPFAMVDVVIDDMPFLVDSLTAELTRSGHAIRLVVHPIFLVRRDGDGTLVEVLDEPSRAEAEGVLKESWIHFEMYRTSVNGSSVVPAESPVDDAEVEERLRRVLGDVVSSVRDWPRMRQRAAEVADELAANPPPVAEGEVDETVGLLRWLLDDNFTFIGCRDYVLDEDDDGLALRAVPGSGLGILHRDQSVSRSFAQLPSEVRARAREPRLLVLTKANSRSTVHRPSYLDYVGIKQFDENGEVVGERRFLGLFTASAYTQSVRAIPFLRQKVDTIVELSGYTDHSHNAKDLLQFLETYPRDELFQLSPTEILPVALRVLHMQERRQVRLFLRADVYGRFVSCIVYLPRDRYSTTVREAFERILRETFDATSIDFTPLVSESVLARLHFVVRVPASEPLPRIDVGAIEAQMLAATRTWSDHLGDRLVEHEGAAGGAELLVRYGDAFPEGYKEYFDPIAAVHDIRRLERLEAPDQVDVRLYRAEGEAGRELHFKVYREGAAFTLSVALPMLQRMGADVVEENVYDVHRADGTVAYVHDFTLRAVHPAFSPEAFSGDLRARFEQTFLAAWGGLVESDGFNALVVAAGLTWREAGLVRAYARYLRQAGSTFSLDYMVQAVVANPEITRHLVRLFEARFDPTSGGEREQLVDDLVAMIESELDAVPSLDHDRILRSLLAVVRATMRTTYFQADDSGAPHPVTAFKLDPRRIPGLPKPVPAHEVWVHSPDVEGVHLRYGAVARGGLRWSDRPEDFRTEVLGLVKAQAVKNSIIVPTGAKGGFVVRRPQADPTDRAAVVAEGATAYRAFVSALLDLTDNRVGGKVVPPPDVVRHDGDDSYLVVAADKGTATFSDLANEVALERGFWLGDAFASGGSTGYDHKAMGITARGAWESVRRHFREMGVDTQKEDFTAVGIGDMSGDVFGNGMLRSPHIRLVAAFDHRHVFVDPDPMDPAAAFAERQRLYDLPRSSWADYDQSLISEGGGVWARTEKSVPITPQIRSALGLDPEVTSLSPTDLIRAALRAPVDLLWNGGIGTYVKSSQESHADVGDKSNDAVRVDGRDLRCKVVGEGGNLGLTQLGRVEAAANGVRLNTDAIDNSAGVGSSDYEVNLKILLDEAVRDGELGSEERNELLASMEDEVAAHVLADNYEQNILLVNARRQAPALLPVHQRLLHELERTADLDRAVEELPSDHEIEQRSQAGLGLYSPELAVITAYVKLSATAGLLETGLPDEPWTDEALRSYFPDPVVERFGDRLAKHPLRREIVATVLVNDMVNWSGATYVFRAMEETGADLDDVVRAYVVARDVFGLGDLWRRVCALDDQVSTAAQSALLLQSRRLLDRAARWFLMGRGTPIDVAAERQRFAEVRSLIEHVPSFLRGYERERLTARAVELEAKGAPETLAGEVALLLDAFALLDVVEVARSADEPAETVAAVYYLISDRYDAAAFLTRITRLSRDDRWSALARSSMRYDLYSAMARITGKVLASTDRSGHPQERVDAWAAANRAALERAGRTLDEIAATESADLATISVALRALRAIETAAG